MLTRDFLKKVSPTMKTVIFDLDAVQGDNKREDEAGALAVVHHFDYTTQVVDFAVFTDHVTLYIKRNKEDKK